MLGYLALDIIRSHSFPRASLSENCSLLLGFNGAETNCGIAHILGILLMNSCNTSIYIFSSYYNIAMTSWVGYLLFSHSSSKL